MTDIADGPEIVEVDEKGNIIEPEAFKRKSGRGRTDEPKEVFSEELLADCREIGIEEFAIRAGGDYRQLEKKKIYWLALPQLLEFEQKDLDTEDDDEFFRWFQGFVKDNKLQTKDQRTERKTRSWDDWQSNFEWKPRKIGSWWSDWGYSTYGGGGDSALTKKLAIALKAVNTTVSVVNDTGKRYSVRLASEVEDGSGATSYTSFNDQRIVVSPKALLDTSVDTDQGIEVTTGFALHEASHVKYSASLFKGLTEPTELRPLTVAQLLWNILEDLRIEQLTAAKFPGFAEYFVTHNAYLWQLQADHMPKQWGPNLQNKINSVIGMTKWPEEYEPTCTADAGLAAEYPWWREWATNYTSGKEPVRMGVIRGLERLAEDEDTRKEMEQLTEDEKAQQAANGTGTPLTDEQFNNMMKQLKELLDNGIDPCPSPSQQQAPPEGGKEIELTEEQASQLERLLGEQYQTHEAFYKMHDGDRNVSPPIETTRPLEDEWSRANYKAPGPMVERLRSAFFFRKKRATESERLLKSGMVDEEELWRVGLGDSRVFERDTMPEETFTSVTMLIDASGSMVGRGLEKAQDLANVMLACLRTQRGVRVRVRAHTTGSDGSGQTSMVYRIWEPGDPDTRIGLLQSIDHGSNFDGFAIDYCAKELDDTSQPDEAKLLIVLSDGLPAGSFVDAGSYVHYGGQPAMEHMMEVSRQWERRGVTIVQIAIDPNGIRPEQQAQMFRHWIGYETDQKLLIDLTALLAKTFGSVEA